jgi:hypothetical protein
MATKKKSKAKVKSKGKSKSKPKSKVKIKAKKSAASARTSSRSGANARGRAATSARGRGSARAGSSARGRTRGGADAEFPAKPRRSVDTDTESSGDERSSLGRGRATRSAQVDDEGNANRNMLKDNYYDPRGSGSESGGQSGDDEGLSVEEDADSESVDELTEEGQDYEAEIVAGVERAATNIEQEVPVDDRESGGTPFGTDPEEEPEQPRRRRGRGRGAD